MPILTDSERDEIVELLIDSVAGGAAPREVLAQLLHETLRGDLPVSGLPNFLATITIDLCLRSDYDLDPPALVKVLEYLINRGIEQATVTPLVDRVRRGRSPAATGPMDALILGSRLPFANRAHLRTILREMFTIPTAAPILLISGGEDSGKSYVAELVEHVCVGTSNAIFCKFAVKPGQGSEATPLALARDLVTQLGGNPEAYPPQNSNTEAWYPELANWIVFNANSAEGGTARAWFVIDGLKRGVLQLDTGKFLGILAEKCARGVAAKRHRMVLSDFSDEQHDKLPNRLKRYTTEPITEDDVRSLVSAIIVASPKFPDAEKPALITESVKVTLQGLNLPLSSVTVFGERVTRLIERAGL